MASDIKPSKDSQSSKIVPITIVTLVLLVFFVWAFSPIKPSQERSEIANTLGQATVTYESFESMRKALKEMTDLQWGVYEEQFIGKEVTWQGWIKEVSGNGGSSSISIDMDPPGSFSVYDIYIGSIATSIAMNLRKGELVRFRGIISSMQGFMGSLQVNLDSAEVTP